MFDYFLLIICWTVGSLVNALRQCLSKLWSMTSLEAIGRMDGGDKFWLKLVDLSRSTQVSPPLFSSNKIQRNFMHLHPLLTQRILWNPPKESSFFLTVILCIYSLTMSLTSTIPSWCCTATSSLWGGTKTWIAETS